MLDMSTPIRTTWSANRVIFLPISVAAVSGCAKLGIQDPIPQQPQAMIHPGQLVGGGSKQIAVGTPPSRGFLPQPQLVARCLPAWLFAISVGGPDHGSGMSAMRSPTKCST